MTRRPRAVGSSVRCVAVGAAALAACALGTARAQRLDYLPATELIELICEENNRFPEQIGPSGP